LITILGWAKYVGGELWMARKAIGQREDRLRHADPIADWDFRTRRPGLTCDRPHRHFPRYGFWRRVHPGGVIEEMIFPDLRLHGRICRATVGVDVYTMAGFNQTDDLP